MTQTRTLVQTLSEQQDSPLSSNTQVVLTPTKIGLIRTAQSTWSSRSVRERLKVIRHLRHLIAENDYDLAKSIQQHRRTPLAEIMAAEILPLAEACEFLERKAKSILKPRKLGRKGRPIWLSGVWTEVHKEPFGVVLVIGPSNYPLFLPACQVLQALVAGNAVLVKPGIGGTEALELLAKLLNQAGLDDDLITILPEPKNSVERAIDAGVDKIVMTGSAHTGQVVLRMAAEHIVPVVAELSGCDAAFVLGSADLDRVVRALTFSMRWNRSETCIAARRVFVDRRIASKLERLLAEAVGKITQDWESTSGSVRAIPLLREALNRGARKIIGDVLPGDSGITPTILTDVPKECSLLQEDVFAPVVSIVAVESMEEALAASKQCPYALGATIFGEERQARELAKDIDAGIVLINDIIVPTADPRMPFGGRGRSGFGITRGAEGLLEMTTVKVISRRRGLCRHLEQPDPTDAELFHRYLQTVHSSSAWKRCREGLAFMRFLWKRALGQSDGDKK
ncbi:MAG: aldehyde dehydrogenase family protein [Gemmataceae bacterium]